jgi:hypothetical protein
MENVLEEDYKIKATIDRKLRCSLGERTGGKEIGLTAQKTSNNSYFGALLFEGSSGEKSNNSTMS